jgi:C4-dicarboxylate-specific signal transduction histidine kinase
VENYRNRDEKEPCWHYAVKQDYFEITHAGLMRLRLVCARTDPRSEFSRSRMAWDRASTLDWPSRAWVWAVSSRSKTRIMVLVAAMTSGWSEAILKKAVVVWGFCSSFSRPRRAARRRWLSRRKKDSVNSRVTSQSSSLRPKPTRRLLNSCLLVEGPWNYSSISRKVIAGVAEDSILHIRQSYSKTLGQG